MIRRLTTLIISFTLATAALGQTPPEPQPQPQPMPTVTPTTPAPTTPPPSAATPPQTPVNAPQNVPPQPAPTTNPAPATSPIGVQPPTTAPQPVQPLGIAAQPAAPAPRVTAAGTVATPNPLHLTIADAIRMALSEGTQAQLARTGEERALIAQREALSGLLPQADARLLRYSQSINLQTFGFSLPGQPPVVGPFQVTDGQIEAAMQLFNVAAFRAYQSRAAGVRASRYQVEQAENDVAAAVARLYVLIARADAQVASRESDTRLFEQLARVANDEFRAGTGTRLDVAQANVQVARARQALLSARNDRESARLALLTAVGADESVDVVLADPLAMPPAPPALDAALATARAQRPELKALATEEQQASLFLGANQARRLPSVALDFTGDWSGTRASDLLWSRRIAGVVSMPIFHGDINANIARAKADLEDARTRRSAAERDVEQEVRSSILTLDNTNARVAVASENVRVAEEALTIARDRRSAGFGSSVEVDRAEDAYRQAHEDLIAARADAAMSWYGLQHATGDIRGTIPGNGTK